jgi:hypothetical protein
MLMIRCPANGQPIATGIEIELESLVQLPQVRSELICPCCGGRHTWSPEQAWLNKSGTDDRGG